MMKFLGMTPEIYLPAAVVTDWTVEANLQSTVSQAWVIVKLHVIVARM